MAVECSTDALAHVRVGVPGACFVCACNPVKVSSSRTSPTRSSNGQSRSNKYPSPACKVRCRQQHCDHVSTGTIAREGGKTGNCTKCSRACPDAEPVQRAGLRTLAIYLSLSCSSTRLHGVLLCTYAAPCCKLGCRTGCLGGSKTACMAHLQYQTWLVLLRTVPSFLCAAPRQTRSQIRP